MEATLSSETPVYNTPHGATFQKRAFFRREILAVCMMQYLMNTRRNSSEYREERAVRRSHIFIIREYVFQIIYSLLIDASQSVAGVT
jgi:hypothetical protein